MQTLRELIESDPANAARTDQELIEWLRGPSGVYQSHNITAAGVMSALGAIPGAAFLDKLEAIAPSVPAVKWVLRFITSDGVDLANEQTRGMLDYLAANGLITDEERDALKAIPPELSRLENAGIGTINMTDFTQIRGA